LGTLLNRALKNTDTFIQYGAKGGKWKLELRRKGMPNVDHDQCRDNASITGCPSLGDTIGAAWRERCYLGLRYFLHKPE